MIIPNKDKESTLSRVNQAASCKTGLKAEGEDEEEDEVDQASDLVNLYIPSI